MHPDKKKAVESVQALLLQKLTQVDYLEAALEALNGDDYGTADTMLDLVKDADREGLQILLDRANKKGMN